MTLGDVVILATRNKGKIAEFSLLAASCGFLVQGLPDECAEVEESGATFAENARLKAASAAAGTGRLAIADDSGLEVDALDKAPGVRSARYSEGPRGPDTDRRNWEKLLAALQGIPLKERTARFRCALAACSPQGACLAVQGVWEGLIALEPSGENGFGYDPVFFDPVLGRTAASLSREEKNLHSHRARALAALLRKWPSFRRSLRLYPLSPNQPPGRL
ncbi:MAG: RdgB/HAM1 family non-canonical purine NTP pyrophosphatase [Deltaproteobacteria bacterium]|nr:RdgB/HAM1 family non-canonical purine NTP pyrophosphatase [Deltaproteobacteria bacterium]